MPATPARSRKPVGATGRCDLQARGLGWGEGWALVTPETRRPGPDSGHRAASTRHGGREAMGHAVGSSGPSKRISRFQRRGGGWRGAREGGSGRTRLGGQAAGQGGCSPPLHSAAPRGPFPCVACRSPLSETGSRGREGQPGPQPQGLCRWPRHRPRGHGTSPAWPPGPRAAWRIWGGPTRGHRTPPSPRPAGPGRAPAGEAWARGLQLERT